MSDILNVVRVNIGNIIEITTEHWWESAILIAGLCVVAYFVLRRSRSKTD